MDAPVKVREQLPRVVRFDPKGIKEALREVEGFNAKLALVITRSVGTMACAYVFAGIALISLPAAINSGQVIVIVAWIAQTFLQLVLLSIIIVGQSVQSAASDAPAAKGEGVFPAPIRRGLARCGCSSSPIARLRSARCAGCSTRAAGWD